MHGGMLMVDREEMHKSLGNFWTVKDALTKVDPEVLRFFLLNAQYRSPIDFTLEGLEEAKRSYDRLRETVRTVHAERRRAPTSGKADDEARKATGEARRAFEAAMDDDFNTREALAAIFEFARRLNKAIDVGVGRSSLDGAISALGTFGDVLGLFQASAAATDMVDGLVDLLVGLREDARKRKDFAASDRIRDGLAALGIVLEDTREGVRWKRR
jgi:cysteinyl-tRNA synthetase